MSTVEKLKGEGDVQIVRRTLTRRECEECGEPATRRHTYLLKGTRGNPASKAYGKDDCSYCSDMERLLCDECSEPHGPHVALCPPEGYVSCSVFTAGDRFAHLFLRSVDEPLHDGER